MLFVIYIYYRSLFRASILAISFRYRITGQRRAILFWRVSIRRRHSFLSHFASCLIYYCCNFILPFIYYYFEYLSRSYLIPVMPRDFAATPRLSLAHSHTAGRVATARFDAAFRSAVLFMFISAFYHARHIIYLFIDCSRAACLVILCGNLDLGSLIDV